jgi:hypothetical protein
MFLTYFGNKGQCCDAWSYHQCNQSIHVTDEMAVMSLSASLLWKISVAMDWLCWIENHCRSLKSGINFQMRPACTSAMYGLPSSLACPSVCLFPCIFALYTSYLATKSINLSASYIVNQYMGYLATKPLHRYLTLSVCFLLWRPRLNPWPIHMGYVMDSGTETFCSKNVSFGRSWSFQLYCLLCIIYVPPVLYNLSNWQGYS